MSILSQTLYWVTTGLLVPSIALLIVFLVVALMTAGDAVGTVLERRRWGPQLDGLFDHPDVATAAVAPVAESVTGPLRRALGELESLGNDAAQRQRILASLEIEHDRALAVAATLSRVGPILGLMGTLIPLGPALLGLAEGDLGVLAENMLVAFATTVVGLMIGGIGFAVQQARRHWAAQDMARADFAVALYERAD